LFGHPQQAARNETAILRALYAPLRLAQDGRERELVRANAQRTIYLITPT